MRRRGAFAVVLACLLAPAPAAADSDPGIHDWQPVPRDRVAAECGMDPDLLEQATPRLADNPFVVVRYGKLCWEGGYPGGTTQTYHIASVTKTFGALLTGMVDSRSTLSDEDVITRWVRREELGAVNPQARIAHILSMAGTNEDLRYGKKRPWSYDTLGDREINQLVGVMNKAIAQEPGQFAGSADARELADREMFDRLGMKASNWPGQSIAGTMNSTVRDMARMGELILQRGRYDGRRLIDEDFMYKLTHPAFEDSNTGYGYLTYLNAERNWGYSTGTNDTECSPYTRWPSYPHRPFFEAPGPNGGFPGEQRHDIGVVWAAGAGGQRIVVHRGLDLVFAVRDDSVSVGESETVGAFEGHKNIWNAIRPALVALDPVYEGDETAFCEAYRRSEYAPDLREPWFAEGASSPPRSAPAPPSCARATGIEGFSVEPNGRGLGLRVDRRADLPFTFSLLREAQGRRILTERVLTRRITSRDAFRLAAGPLRDGWYVAHVTMKLPDGRSDVRRVVLRRERGRFTVRPDAGVHRACGVIEDVALGRSVFGGRDGRRLAVAYRLRGDAERVTLRVLGGGRGVSGPATAGRTHRLRLSPRGLPRGDVRVQLAVVSDGVTSTEVVVARRL
jgi:CubicO group peptidase (beta-lactamase class C family)